ncbi:hypothetical protein SDC9_141733 [bioreactor metagenome]|uniref:Uncharacterized protein n=1 Tax=bioreactor metagenome TaxID=1076179 RepID=A0A645DYY2_9ZZZZ
MKGAERVAATWSFGGSLPTEQNTLVATGKAQKEQYRKTGKGGAEVANYETYFDYMTGLTDYYAEQLR